MIADHNPRGHTGSIFSPRRLPYPGCGVNIPHRQTAYFERYLKEYPPATITPARPPRRGDRQAILTAAFSGKFIWKTLDAEVSLWWIFSCQL